MRILKLVLIALILCIIVIPPISCSEKTETIPGSQLVTVQRGDLTVDITASGNLDYSDYKDLAFQISGASTQQPLTVAEVNVQAGDSVAEGQVLVKADTVYLEQAITTAERAAKTSEIALEKAKDSWRSITYPYTVRTFTIDVPAAISFTSDAQRKLDEAVEIMQKVVLQHEQADWGQYGVVLGNIEQALDNLTQAKANLKRWSGPDVFGTPEGTQLNSDNTSVSYTQGIVPMASYWTLRSAQQSMDAAQVALDTANDNLNQARDNLKKSVIVAPFAGFVTIVNVKGGDTVQRGVVAVRLVDPNKFEAAVMVSEMDIFQVKVGGDATVQIDAMPAVVLPAKVTFISPTATITSGVVNYQVKVEVQPLETVMRGQQGQMPTMLPEGFQLREGLTATVNIIVQQKTNVLLVPNGAITSQGEKTYVQVMSAGGVAEKREITTGISNWQYTEVTKGLGEGERVVVPEGTTTTTSTTSTTQQQRGPSGGMMIPGVGGPPR